MLYYIREFPERLHHPRENAYLFRKLRMRTSELDETLDELERQHDEGNRLVADLADSVARYESNTADGFAAFAKAVERFASAQMAHMRLETKVILPAARRHLKAEDWVEIGRAFADNGDPRFSIDNNEEFRHLFARILNLVPDSAVGGVPVSAR
jgi:hemerythrin-like domain-containing protein